MMSSNILMKWIVVLVCGLCAVGCSKKANPPAASAEPTKTAAEYKAEADKQINEQNMSDELSKLEQEVSAEDSEP